ncbi:uncharacterized protein LOC123988668 [Osmia bicornis bicornis]|uniref:uncharacterized protein LOC123988433 n=1 Tax=Osmia bicornis bicornis TaxID=1437191 RepID=UPI001EAF25E1|nr:uncharacterized protein LOC123988433 [Osmia bicornis bicornis]XP_046145125.1 uncharacterized protein LOC123988576 [Osmia bicornis bicornis]XP_046145323.1 uncharacterized protein LOC123988624 [Osmia bicornis bicornis]XP_046145376.1 uncharacterized protein LOC123988668 [Osmia bicornis bicornis]
MGTIPLHPCVTPTPDGTPCPTCGQSEKQEHRPSIRPGEPCFLRPLMRREIYRVNFLNRLELRIRSGVSRTTFSGSESVGKAAVIASRAARKAASVSPKTSLEK